MALEQMLSDINKHLGGSVGQISKIEKSIVNIANLVPKIKSGMANLTASAGSRFDARNTSGASGGVVGIMPTSLGTFSGQGGGRNGGGTGERTFMGMPKPSFGAVTSGAGGTSGGAGNGAGGGGGNMPVSANGSANVGGSRFSGLAIAAGAASAAWQGTPGVRDAVAYQSSLFPVAFATAGQYNNKTTGQRIINAINSGASSPFDPTAAAAAMTYSGYTMNMGKTADRMLTTAGAMFQMTGMNNIASVQGSMALSQGSAGVSEKLMGIGITTVGPKGNPKDLGVIIDQLWDRWYGGREITEAQLDRDIAMGFVGADLQELFGSQPALYQQAMLLLRLKVKEGGRKGIRLGKKSGKNSAVEVARKYGLNDYNSPMAAMGGAYTSQNKLLMEASEGLLSGFVGGTNTEEAMATAGAALIEFTGPLGDATLALKGFTQTLSASPTAGPVASTVLGFVKGLFAGGGSVYGPGGFVQGPGGTTSDSITARLSKGEFVINARAAQQIGLKNLNALNALGHAFGSGFASPSSMFNKGGEVNGSDVVDLATQYVGTPYVDSAKLKGGQSSAGPENGWDCSTFTHWVYKQFGVTLPTYSDSYLNVGSPVSRDDLQPGDILLWNTHSGKKTGHVSIYAGNGEHVHAANSEAGTVRGKISQWYWDRYVGARRVSSAGMSAPNNGGVNASNSDSSAGTQTDPNVLISAIGGAVEYAKGFTSTSGLSLSSLGTIGPSIGSFTNGSGLNTSGVANNSATLLNNIIGLFSGGGSGTARIDDKQSGTGSAADTGAAGTGTQTNPSVDSSMTRDSFASAILSAIGAATTKVSSEAMLEWMRHEGGHWNNDATYNPLNTTKVMDGNDKSINSHGVKAYSNWQEGLDATLATLRLDNYGYPEIIRQFQEGKDIKAIYSAINKSQWGTKTLPGYSHGAQYVSKDQVAQLHQGEMVFPAAVAQDFRDALREALNGGGNKVPVNITLNIAKASDEEAERFARKVMGILNNNDRMERLRTS